MSQFVRKISTRIRPRCVSFAASSLTLVLAGAVQAAPAGLEPASLASIAQGLARKEYEASLGARGLQAPNRAQDLRVCFEAWGVRLVDRTDPGSPVLAELRLAALGRQGRMSPPGPAGLSSAGARVELQRPELVEWYVNTPAGLEQGFTLQQRPTGEGPLALEIALGPAQGRMEAGRLVLIAPSGDRLSYGALHAFDAKGAELPSSIELPEPGRLRLLVDDAQAVYPLTVDPLVSRTFDGLIEGQQAGAGLGTSVARAGDVNGDGYGDVVIGAPYYDSGASDAGLVYVVYGSPDGLLLGSPTPLSGDQADGRMGYSVAGAGDVNGDGYADIVAGAPLYDTGATNDGAVFLFLGGSGGIQGTGAATAAAKLRSDSAGALFGWSVGGAGDVNGDGLADVLVGAPAYNAAATGGAFFVFRGSASGIPSGNLSTAATTILGGQANVALGFSVDGAGDVNGDGYADVIAGGHGYDLTATDEGAAFVLLGGPNGIPSGNASTGAVLHANQTGAGTGYSVAGAGDVNGDGYSDVIVGAVYYDAGETDEGAAFVFLGSGTGMQNADPGTADAVLQSNQANAAMGISVGGLGDVNGDGYSDVVAGASSYDGNGTNSGLALVLLGSLTGIPNGAPDSAPYLLAGTVASESLGGSVAGAGDVNGDGYADLVVGAPNFTNGQTFEGRAFQILGGAAGPTSVDPASAQARLQPGQADAKMGTSVASAGDVNGDGFADVIVGAPDFDSGQTSEGAAFVYLGSPSGPLASPAVLEGGSDFANLGSSVAGAGDVNGDGYADVIVGAPFYDNGSQDEGAAFVFLGSSSGVASGTPATAAAILESNQVSAEMGASVAGVGDVNGDGYSDVVVGATSYDANANDGGAAFVFLGSATGVASAGPATAASKIESNVGFSRFGCSVAGAGDVNGDGYADLVVGASQFQVVSDLQSGEGSAFVFHGSATGIASGLTDVANAKLESNQVNANLGFSVAGAGDVNGDGYADVIVGAPFYGMGQASEGVAFVFLGSATGVANGHPGTAATTLQSDRANDFMGMSVAGAGDVNGDGYADVVVADPKYDVFPINTGAAFVFLGSAAGVLSGGPATASTKFGSSIAGSVGSSVAGAGDVNGDGFADVLVGAKTSGIGGSAFVLNGNSGTSGRSSLPRQMAGNTPIQPWSRAPLNSFQVRLTAFDALGRARVKLQVETCPAGTDFGQPGCSMQVAPQWTDGTASSGGVMLTETISGFPPASLVHWRARVLRMPFSSTQTGITAPPSPEHGPWRRLSGQALEADLRIGAAPTQTPTQTPTPTPTSTPTLVAGATVTATPTPTVAATTTAGPSGTATPSPTGGPVKVPSSGGAAREGAAVLLLLLGCLLGLRRRAGS